MNALSDQTMKCEQKNVSIQNYKSIIIYQFLNST